MSDKPMLSVDLGLLQRAVNGGKHEHREAMAELRMLLRETGSITSKGPNPPKCMSLDCSLNAECKDGYCRRCQ